MKADLYESIFRRKSCRRYLPEGFSQEELEEIRGVLEGFPVLHPEAPLDYRFTKETKGMFHVKAPHYLVISGTGKEGEDENAGFVGQQFMLWLDSQDLGGVWLGASKDATETKSSSDIIVIAFGRSEGEARRTIDKN